MMMKSKVSLRETSNQGLIDLEKFNKAMGKRPHVVVGVPKGASAYPDGTDVLMVALVHEFGSQQRNIPERSFLRAGVAEKRKEFAKLFAEAAEEGLEGKDMLRQLKLIGLQAQTWVRQKVTDLKSPPLKSRNGNPLVDTGHLRSSITYEVRNGANKR